MKQVVKGVLPVVQKTLPLVTTAMGTNYSQFSRKTDPLPGGSPYSCDQDDNDESKKKVQTNPSPISEESAPYPEWNWTGPGVPNCS